MRMCYLLYALDESACVRLLLPKTFKRKKHNITVAAAVMRYESDNPIKQRIQRDVAKNYSVLVCVKDIARGSCAR